MPRIHAPALLACILAAVVLLTLGCAPGPSAPTADPLPSWADGPTKAAIVAFVDAVTDEGGPRFVPPEARIATFDQDGTLWVEQPVAQLEFVAYRIRQMAPEHPEWNDQQPFKAVLEGDNDYLLNDFVHNHGREVMKLMAVTHSGMPLAEFNGHVREFIDSQRHSRYDKRYNETIYQPMLELLRYLRDNAFKTWLCSGGGIDFMRVFSEETYGIAPEQVIGSFGISRYEQVDGRWTIVKDHETLFVNDGLTKPAGIVNQIGRIPIFVGGNVRTGGDIGQLSYSATNPLPNFQLLIHHDDAEREYAYAEPDNASLDAAAEGGWQVVSMKDDWKRIFPFDPAPAED